MRSIIDASEVHDLADHMQRHVATVEPRARDIVADMGRDVLATMRATTFSESYETGELVASESLDVDGLSFEAGPSVEHGVYVELGTSRMSAEPFAGPAFDTHLPRALGEFALLGEGIV